MSKIRVKPLRSFVHNGSIVGRRSDAILMDSWQADQMIGMGLVEPAGKDVVMNDSAADQKPTRKTGRSSRRANDGQGAADEKSTGGQDGTAGISAAGADQGAAQA